MEYYKRDEKALQAEWQKDRRAEASRDRENGNNSIYTLKEGRTIVRVLPSPSSARGGMWFREMREYYFKLDKDHLFLTTPRDFELPDPLWDWGQSIYDEADEKAVEESKRFRPTTRYLMNGLVLSDPKEGKIEDGIKVLKVPTTVKLAMVNFDYEQEYGDITNPEAGFNLIIDREGTGRNTKYSVMPQRNRSNIFELVVEKGLNPQDLKLFDLDDVHKSALLPFEELSAILEQVKTVLEPKKEEEESMSFGQPEPQKAIATAPLSSVAQPDNSTQTGPISSPVMAAPEGQSLPEGLDIPKPPTGGEQ